jgi:hypothetical protein
VREFVERIRRHATVVNDPVEQPAVTRDRKDDYLVALARAERVDAVVSGDRDLVDAALADPAVWTSTAAGGPAAGELNADRPSCRGASSQPRGVSRAVRTLRSTAPAGPPRSAHRRRDGGPRASRHVRHSSRALGLHISSTVAGELLPSCLYAIGDGHGIRALPLGPHGAGVVRDAPHSLRPAARRSCWSSYASAAGSAACTARSLINAGVVCSWHTGAAISLITSETPWRRRDCAAASRGSISLTARNTSRESAAGSGENLDATTSSRSGACPGKGVLGRVATARVRCCDSRP